MACFSCLAAFPPAQLRRADSGAGAKEAGEGTRTKVGKREKRKEIGISESGRYECETCHTFFCIDCDVFCHDVVHNCPGCQSREGDLLDRGLDGDGDGRDGAG